MQMRFGLEVWTHGGQDVSSLTDKILFSSLRHSDAINEKNTMRLHYKHTAPSLLTGDSLLIFHTIAVCFI